VVLHEIAHAVVAMACGAEVTGMRLGFGPRLSPTDSPFDVRPLIVAAHVSYVPPRGVTRPKLIAIAGAGLVVHLVAIVVALSLGGGEWPAWRVELLAANGFALLGNAIPMVGGFTSTSPGPNDGAHIAKLLAHRGTFASAYDPDVREVYDAYDRRGVAAAIEKLDALDRKDVAYLRLTVALRALDQQRWTDARDLVRGAGDPARPWLAPYVFARAEGMDMLLERTGTAERVAAAEHAAMSAVGGLPTSTPYAERAVVLHTLSLVRLLQGRWDEAAGLCTWALGGTTTDGQRSSVLAVQSWAMLGLGRRAEAEHLLSAAMQLQNGPLVRAASRAFARTPTG
jgi:hypothetical protein